MEKTRISFQDAIAKNKLKSTVLMISIFAVIILLGYVISFAFEPGYFFIIISFSIIFSMGYLLITYYNSDKIALMSVRAKQIKREENKKYYDSVEGLTLASGLPMPRLYVMPSHQINAFASGRNPKNSVICITQGALEKLDKKELEGVLAHELSHIANYDMRFITLVAVMVGMISIISEMFLRSLWFKSGGGDSDSGKGNAIFMIIGIILAILAPIVVYFVQLAISRKREYSADATAVKFTRYPPGLISALRKIKNENQPDKKINKALVPLFFANPFAEIASTHPAIDKRIQILEKM